MFGNFWQDMMSVCCRGSPVKQCLPTTTLKNVSQFQLQSHTHQLESVSSSPCLSMTLPDVSLHACPDWFLQSLRCLHVAPVQPRVGNLVLRFRVWTHAALGTSHHYGEGTPVRLELDHMELLLVSQHLVGLLKDKGRRKRGLIQKKKKQAGRMTCIFLS